MKIRVSRHFYRFMRIHEITFTNNQNMIVTFSSFGASIYEIQTPDKKGHREVITLTPEKKRDFYYAGQFYGKTIGRTAGRIKDGQLFLDGQTYNLSANRNGITLHGGWNSMSFRQFTYKIIKEKACSHIIFTHTSLDGDNGYPGEIMLTVRYTVYDNENRIDISYHATTDKKTVLNITNHTYFNLSGNMKKSILDHELMIPADRYATLDKSLNISEIAPVDEVMDFQKFKFIRHNINSTSLVESQTRGYDHTFLKTHPENDLAAILYDPESGREVTIETSYPGVVFYSMNFPGHNSLKKRVVELKWSGVALECEYLANDFSQMTITPEKEYNHRITYKFAVR